MSVSDAITLMLSLQDAIGAASAFAAHAKEAEPEVTLPKEVTRELLR